MVYADVARPRLIGSATHKSAWLPRVPEGNRIP